VTFKEIFFDMSRQYQFNINLSVEKTESIYAGHARFILAYDNSGLKLRLPAENFRQYVTRNGIHGRFQVNLDSDNKIKRLIKL
jgi:hypothetical protein